MADPSKQQLLQLGLDPRQLESWTQLPAASDDVAEGKGLAAAIASVAALVTSDPAAVHFAETNLPHIEQAGFEVRPLVGNQNIMMVASSQGLPLSLQSLDKTEARAVLDEHDADVCYVEANTGDIHVVALPDGRSLLIVGASTSPKIAVAKGNLSSLVAALQQSVAPHDGWLSAFMAAQDRTPYGVAKALGGCSRLLDTKAFAQGSLQQLERGELDALLLKPRHWVQQLNAELVQEIVAAALQDVQQAQQLFLENRETAASELAEPLLELAHKRDDLESARMLLAEIGASDPLEEQLFELDSQVAPFVASLPRQLVPADERSSRVLRADPALWWSLVGVGV